MWDTQFWLHSRLRFVSAAKPLTAAAGTCAQPLLNFAVSWDPWIFEHSHLSCVCRGPGRCGGQLFTRHQFDVPYSSSNGESLQLSSCSWFFVFLTWILSVWNPRCRFGLCFFCLLGPCIAFLHQWLPRVCCVTTRTANCMSLFQCGTNTK